MFYLDWYLSLNERDRERGYELGLLICPDPETIVKKIIPKAVEIACKSARKQNRRDDLSRKHWKMRFTAPQLYQIGILEASRNYAKSAGHLPANWLTCYIAFLSLCTLQRNSFYVAVGFERILNTGSALDTLELYEWLSYRLSPDEPPTGRDEKSLNDICSSLHEQIYREFKDAFQTDGDRLMFDKVPKCGGEMDGEIYRILDQMIPWETDHLPNANQAQARSYQKIVTEMSLAHVCIDQQRCLEYVKRDNRHISNSFDTWKVPIPNIILPVEPPGPPAPRWPEVKEEIMKEIHWSEEKSKRGWGAVFEVVVDGEIKDSVAPGGSVEISLPPLARYVEIRDAESKAMVANCHLMDPHDIPEIGWRNSVEMPAGGRINFEFSPDPLGDKMAGLSMRIGIDSRPGWSTFVRNQVERVFQPRPWSSRRKSLAWAACAACLTVALSISFITLYNLRAQLRELRQANSDLQMQISDIEALKIEIAKLQQSRIQAPYSPSQLLEVLHDGQELVALDAQGNLIGMESIPQSLQGMIKTALTTGHIDVLELRTLGGRAAKLMGKNADSEIFTLVSPVGIVIETNRPTLRWKPLNGAASYTVSISDSNYNEVAVGKSLSETQWTSDHPLERGKVYSWQVIALKEGKEIKSPSAPGIMAKFQVLDQAKADELARAKKTNPSSNLIMGLLYARAGLLSEAEREFKALLAANPKSSAAQKLLENVRALRRAG